jgi:hypothetical protein
MLRIALFGTMIMIPAVAAASPTGSAALDYLLQKIRPVQVLVPCDEAHQKNCDMGYDHCMTACNIKGTGGGISLQHCQQQCQSQSVQCHKSDCS